MATAQKTYSEMMKSEIAPRLRALGFKGSGQNYRLPSDNHWAMLGFQKSAYSDAERVRFTINVLVVPLADWDAAGEHMSSLPKRPTANTYWGVFVWQTRIGSLVPGDQDLWWDLRAGADTRELADAVLWAVTDYALPAMKRQMQK